MHASFARTRTPPTAYQKHQLAVEQAKQEYRDAGGNDDRLLIPKKVGLKELRKATEDIPLNQAKKEYRDAGGKKKSILDLSYSELGKIRAETILLQNKNENKK